MVTYFILLKDLSLQVGVILRVRFHTSVCTCVEWQAPPAAQKINNGFLQLIPVPDGNNLRSFKMVFQMVLPSDELERVQEPESVYLQTFSVLKS